MSKSAPQTQKASSNAIIQRDEEQRNAAAKAQPNIDKQHITPAQVPYLQRTMGNRAVVQLLRNQAGGPIQPKLQVGPVGDKYEQEADRIASQVMRSPAPVQRHDEEEGVQRSPLTVTPLVQRDHGEGMEEEDEELQRSPLKVTPLVQRDLGEGIEEEDEELQRSPAEAIQRNFPHGATHSPMPGMSMDEEEMSSKK